MSEYFYDNFTDLSLWQRWTLRDDALHRIGYEGFDPGGARPGHDWNKVPGRRAAFYDDYLDKTARVVPGGVEMRCHLVEQHNPYRTTFDARYRGEERHFPYGQYIPYLTGFVSASRIWDNEREHHVLDYSQPTWLIGPGCDIIMNVDYTQNVVRNLWHSLWDMPAFEHSVVCAQLGIKHWTDLKRHELIESLQALSVQPPLVMSDAYDKSILNGVENDVIEYASSLQMGTQTLSQKLVVGEGEQTVGETLVSGDTVNVGTVANGGLLRPDQYAAILYDLANDPNCEVRCRWNMDGTREWFINGTRTNVDPRRVDTLSYVLLTNEMSSGIKLYPDDNPNHDFGYEELYVWEDTDPWMRRDAGLTGQPWILDWELIEHHKTTVHSVEVRLLNHDVIHPVPCDVVPDGLDKAIDRIESSAVRLEALVDHFRQEIDKWKQALETDRKARKDWWRFWK